MDHEDAQKYLDAKKRSQRRNIAFGVAIAALVAVGLPLMISGVGAALLQIDTTPAPGEPERFRPVEHYGAIADFAGGNVRLIRMNAKYVKADGTIDLTADYEPDVEFRFVRGRAVQRDAPRGVTGPVEGLESVSVQVTAPWTFEEESSNTRTSGSHWVVNRGLRRYTGRLTVQQDTTSPPKCTLGAIWKAAAAAGAPTDAVATISYFGDVYHFRIDAGDRPFTMQLDADCRPK